MNDPRQGANRRNQLPIQPPPSNSTSHSGRSNPHTTQTSSRNASENPPISQSLSPSILNQSIPPDSDSDRYNLPNITAQPVELGPLDPSEQFAGYGFPPGGPSAFDWPNSYGTEEYGAFYQPQGTLYNQFQTPQIPYQDFSNPFPVRRESGHGSLGSNNPSLRAQSISMLSAAQSPTHDMSSRSPLPSIVTTRSGQKRKASRAAAESVPQSATSQMEAESVPKRPSVSRTSTLAAQQADPRATRRPPSTAPASDAGKEDEEEGVEQSEASISTSKQKDVQVSMERRIAEVSSRLGSVLPAGQVFVIQIGSEVFRLSGASLSSDAPSYFSHFFGEQLIQSGGRKGQLKALYIDRDPNTFKDIALHLQGYFVKPRDEEHFVRLFADAHFYSLPRLTQQLFKEIYIQVGDRHFQIPREIFSSPGDNPNFFSLGFAHFFSTPSEVFPGLDRQTLLRPPSILPPAVANRSGDVFADLLRIMQGYDVNIRDAGHRAELLRDAKYFHFKGVEQKLIPCEISQNILRGRSEILLRLEDIRQSGVSFLPESADPIDGDSSVHESGSPHSTDISTSPVGWITYQRPYVDNAVHDLILEISSSEATKLDLAAMRAEFSGQTKARVASLFSVVANKLNLPATQPLGLMLLQSGGGIAVQPASPANSGVSGDRVRIQITRDAFVILDGESVDWDEASDEEEDSDEAMSEESTTLPRVRKWKEGATLDKDMEWWVRKGQWRLRVEKAEGAESTGKIEVVLCAVRLEGYTKEVHRNRGRGFLV